MFKLEVCGLELKTVSGFQPPPPPQQQLAVHKNVPQVYLKWKGVSTQVVVPMPTRTFFIGEDYEVLFDITYSNK